MGLTPKFLSLRLPETPVSKMQELVWEGALLGMYLSGHPIDASGIAYENFESIKSARQQNPSGATVKALAMLAEVRLHTDKNSKQMAFLKLQDRHMMTASAVLFARQYAEYKTLLEPGAVLYMQARMEQRDHALNPNIDKLVRWENGHGGQNSDALADYKLFGKVTQEPGFGWQIRERAGVAGD